MNEAIAEKTAGVADKIHAALTKVPDKYIPFVIGNLLRKYERYGLADIVETAWHWKPKEGERITDEENELP